MADKRPLDPSKQCTAKSRTTGERCRQRARINQTKCRFHGGNSPNALKKARERATEKKILTELERGKLTGKALVGTTDPLSELQKVTTELVHFKDQLTQMVNALGDDITHFDAKNTEAARVVIDLYMRANKELTKTLDIALKHDIEGKKLALETAKAEMVAAAMTRTMNALGLNREQIEQAREILHKELTSMAQIEA